MEMTDFIEFLKKEVTLDSRGHSSDLFESVVNSLHTTGEVYPIELSQHMYDDYSVCFVSGVCS